MAIRPGSFNGDPTDYAGFVNSMAAAMEQELNDLLALDGLPALPADPNDREVRDRRRLFVAIARGVVRHLRDRADSIDVTDSHGVTAHPVIHTEGL